MSSDFTFNGTSLSSLGGMMERPTIEVATRDAKFIELAGRSHDDFIDLGRYKSVEFSRTIGFRYQSSVHSSLAQTIRDWLDTGKGYCDFTDSDHEGFTTKAAVINPPQLIKEAGLLHKGEVTFRRDPYWYSDAGQTAEEITDDGQKGQTFTNPYNHDAYPKIVFTLIDTALTDGKLYMAQRVYEEDGETEDYVLHMYLTGLEGTVGSNNYVVVDIENGYVSEYTSDGTFVQLVTLSSNSDAINKFYFPAGRKVKNWLSYSSYNTNCSKKSVTPNWRTI